MNMRLGSSLLTLSVCLTACSQPPVTQATRSLRGSSDVSFVCTGYDSAGNYAGRPLDACPSYYPSEVRNLLALATQRETGEVAVIDLSTCENGGRCEARVRDLEVTQPGTNFLPVGAEPVSIVSTPGGTASFVAVAEPGREGLFALPTSCIGTRLEGQAYRDLRTWPACRLPSTPGAMAVLVDSNRATDCAGERGQPDPAAECPADTTRELVPAGRRKLVVALPELGELVILDAQNVLELPPGTFAECPIEQRVALQVELPDTPPVQELPEDLEGSDAVCRPPEFNHPPRPSTFAPRPSDLALSGGRLYVSDASAPVVHVLDVSDACGVSELEPLLPVSYSDPESVVSTRKLAVSPYTTSGKQYVYAVDGSDGPRAGSLMVFDVSPDASQRTPIVRPRAAYVSNEPPDRIQFDQEVADVEFAFQDQPLPDRDGIAREGLFCDANPSARTSPGAVYRPNDEGTGASPNKLRGVFAFAALRSGYVSVIDVEDLDAPCRRPREANPTSEPDERGCADDPSSAPFEVSSTGELTVTNELTCHAVVPHRPRAARAFNDSSTGSAPFLRSFPQLRAADGTSLAVDRTRRGRRHPRLLAVNFAPGDDTPNGSRGDASVMVGATRYLNEPNVTERLELDPSRSERNSLVLPYAEPRAYAAGAVPNTVTFEGPVRGISDSPFSVVSSEELGPMGLQGATYGMFSGGINAGFCASGIEDWVAMRARGAVIDASLDEEQLDEFASRHVDYVEITEALLPKRDPYWSKSPGQSCGAEYQTSGDRLDGYSVCELFFGSPELPDRHRELSVVRAFEDRLIVEPRSYESRAERDAVLELAACCFPGGVDHRVRASQQWVLRSGSEFRHPIRVNPETLACERSCDPLVANQEGRVFEISCDGEGCAENPEGEPVIGPSVFPGDDPESEFEATRASVCILDQHPSGGVQPGGPGSACVYRGLTARFAIYRGLSPSERDMQFAWTRAGGFAALSIDLFETAGFRSTTMPEKIVYLSPINRMMVADGGSTGVFFVGLRRSDGGPGLSSGYAY